MNKISVLAVLLLASGLTGCSWFHGHKSTATAKKPAAHEPIVTPDLSLAAKVVDVNEVGRFVVLNFPPNQLPKPQQTMFLYHAGLKVAQVTITGTVDTQNNNVVADIVSGSAHVGDAVRGD